MRGRRGTTWIFWIHSILCEIRWNQTYSLRTENLKDILYVMAIMFSVKQIMYSGRKVLKPKYISDTLKKMIKNLN